MGEGAAECARLESAVRSGPLAQDVRFDYHPHVTVAHEVPDSALDRAFAELSEFEARFVVSGFQFYEHGDDNVWRPVRDYLFTGSSARPRTMATLVPVAPALGGRDGGHPIGMTGRTSTAPFHAAGIRAAAAIASSRSAHSSRKNPVSTSLVSA